MFNKGNILLPSNRVAKRDWLNGLFHPAIVWDNFYDGHSDFHGIMLTHSESNGRFDNVLMAANHFEVGHEVGFSNTHFVNQLFVKFLGWGPFELVGNLSEEGIEFVNINLSNLNLLEFETYLKVK